jgi:hypothetical protein
VRIAFPRSLTVSFHCGKERGDRQAHDVYRPLARYTIHTVCIANRQLSMILRHHWSGVINISHPPPHHQLPSSPCMLLTNSSYQISNGNGVVPVNTYHHSGPFKSIQFIPVSFSSFQESRETTRSLYASVSDFMDTLILEHHDGCSYRRSGGFPSD